MGKTKCLCFIFFFVLLASLATLVTLCHVGVHPKFYMQEVYIPSLKNPNSYNATNLNTSITIDLKFKRVVTIIPIIYKDINLTLYYASNKSSGAIGHAVVPGFSQHRRKTAHRRVVVEARALPWEEAFEKISGGSTVALTAELAAKYKFCDDINEARCYSKEGEAVVVAADFQVDASGADVSKNPMRLH